MSERAYLPPAKNENWGTPQYLFDSLDEQYHFDLDAAASAENTKCARFYTKEQNSLIQPWTGRVWCNPPHGRNVGEWVRRAHDACLWDHTAEVAALLLKSCTETRWFHPCLSG